MLSFPPPGVMANCSMNKCGLLLTSSSDLNSSNYLRLDVAGEEGPGKVEAGYKNRGCSLLLPGGGVARESVAVELPLDDAAALVTNQRAAVSDDTGG